MLLSAPFAFLANIRSRTAEVTSFDNPAPHILSGLTPIQAAIHSYLLVTLYSVTLGSVMLLLKY